ncbi:MAG: hypothetical protein P1U68_09755 [Verrucomicrobiales bacterium]|nr:hypothetical protein [Verrucomicrobiales bacterium]
MRMKGFIGLAIVFAIGFLLIGLTKCGYDKLEELQEAEAVSEE